MATETQQRVYDRLRRMPEGGLAAAKQFFCTELTMSVHVPLSWHLTVGTTNAAHRPSVMDFSLHHEFII